MSSADQEGKPAATPLDAEREALRKAGYTETEISQILIARAASQHPAAGASQGVMSNVLSSILGVASHARMLIPTFRTDVETVFDGAATASARAGATASLAVKAIVVIVLGFAAWQEWRQHIIAAPETATQQTINITEQAKHAAEREKAIAEKAAAEAAVAKEINEAQLRKTKAEECSARMKAMLETQPPAKAAGTALQQECSEAKSDNTSQTQAGPLNDAQAKTAELVNFYIVVAAFCDWRLSADFNIANDFLAKAAPSDYAAGLANAEQSFKELVTKIHGDWKLGCMGMKPLFDEFAAKLDTSPVIKALRAREQKEPPPAARPSSSIFDSCDPKKTLCP